MKIALACSAGGHLTELKQLEPAYRNHDTFFVTFKREDTKDIPHTHFISDPKRNPLALLKTTAQSLLVFLRERPDAILTTGAGVVIPFCLIGKLFGKKIVYIESFCRVEEPSFTGKIMYRIADSFFVQWETLLGRYGPKARYEGRLV